MSDSSLSRGTLLGRAYSIDNQGLGDSYEVLCPLKFRRLLPRMVSYAGALTLNFRWSVPGKPLYSKAWPLHSRGCYPGSHPKWSLNCRAPKICQDISARCAQWRGYAWSAEALGAGNAA